MDWLARFLEWHRRPDRPWLQEMRNNRWLQLREQRLPDGRTAVAYSNVTELVRARQGLRSAELAAQQARAQLEDGIGALAEAFALWDPNDCLVVCNRRYHELFWDTRDLQLRGVAFETIIRAGVARGHVPAAVGREEDWIADRLERHRNTVGPILHPMPDDHWLHVDERRTRDGGYVGIRADVTELVRSRRELQQLMHAWPRSRRARTR